MTDARRTSRSQRITSAIVAACAAHHGVASEDEILATGLSRSGLRHGVATQRLFEIYRAYALSPVVTADGRRTAAILSYPWPTALAGWSALELYGAAPRPNGRHHLATTSRRKAQPGLLVSRARRPLPVRRVRGIPAVEPVRALLDVALTTSGRPLERLVGDTIHAGVIREPEFEAAAAQYPGHHGLGNLLAVTVEDAKRRRTVLPLAEEMLLALDTLPIPPPVCEYKLTGFSGRPYRADFAWPDRSVILEADGRSTHERREAMDADRMRDDDLTAAGIRTLRFTWRQLRRERVMFDRLVVATVGHV
ncbi:MAG: DUF559 domain-containing protein [Solirubrobacteraceae bacterium]|nr:DUF559 domain-containing protein [Solirubrobacteraceae bacterium]